MQLKLLQLGKRFIIHLLRQPCIYANFNSEIRAKIIKKTDKSSIQLSSRPLSNTCQFN